ncbi:MAG: hypothetical protein HXX13_05915 [Bacteroidetes bacterium]|nr:hypothetical protein [Bacteroidota bacterium]
MKSYFIPLFAVIMLLSFACQRNISKPENIVTKRIQYDVSIKSPDPDFDWWVQNLEGEKRESVVKNIINNATEGKVKAYDFFTNKLLTVKQVHDMLFRADTIQLQRPNPPFEFYDTVISQNANINNISRLRFLEEWSMDEKSLAFSKKVLGICPLMEAYTDNGELKGYKPLFWVFFDDRYPGEFMVGK